MRYSRSITFPIVVLLLAMLSSIFAVSSQTATAVFLTPSTSSPHLGETFYVTVSLSNVQNLYGLEVILKWNPAVLRALGADIRLGVETFPDGILHESSSTPAIFIAEDNLTQTEGEYRLVATSVSSASSFSGSGNIVKITFEPIILGDSALDLESQLFDYPPVDRDPRTSFPIEHATLDSFVTVKEPTLTPSPALTPTPTPTSTPTTTPTSSPTLEPSTLNVRIEHVLAILAIMVIIIVLILFVLRRRK